MNISDLYYMTDVQDIVDNGLPDGYFAHCDGPEGYLVIEEIRECDDPLIRELICKGGIIRRRELYAPVFCSWMNQSGL